MSEEIVIKAGSNFFEAELDESVTGKVIFDALPIEAKAQRWGGEIYFSIGVRCELEGDSRDVLEEGELGYWPPGRAFCIFFGPTQTLQALPYGPGEFRRSGHFCPEER